jgi:hypothetical protein
MKKLGVSILLLLLLSNQLFAMKAVVTCRTGGIIHKSHDAIGINCGNSSSYQCENNLKNYLNSKYGTNDHYYAMKKVCRQLGGDWYPDRVRIRY